MTAQTLAFPMPHALGNIDAYIQAANQYPMLSAQEEAALARRLRDESDLDAARQLVLSHLRLVISIARGYLGYGLPHADLIQEGNIGLMKAVKRFDPERGVRLVSFAIHWVKAEIHEYILKNWRLVRVATTKAQRKLFFNLRSLKGHLAGEGSNEGQNTQIAEQLDVSPSEVREMEKRLIGHDVSLENNQDERDENHFAPIDFLADSSHEPTTVLERRASLRLQSNGLQTALKQLDERSRRIIEARWLPGDDNQTATLHDMAAEFAISAERVRQIESKALATLRKLLGADAASLVTPR